MTSTQMGNFLFLRLGFGVFPVRISGVNSLWDRERLGGGKRLAVLRPVTGSRFLDGAWIGLNADAADFAVVAPGNRRWSNVNYVQRGE